LYNCLKKLYKIFLWFNAFFFLYFLFAESQDKFWLLESLKIRFLFFSTLAHNDQGYAHPAVCGSFTVAMRQGECGSKTAGMHVSQPVPIGVC